MNSRVLSLALAAFALLMVYYLVLSGSISQPDSELFLGLNALAGNMEAAIFFSVMTQLGSEVILALIGLLSYFLSSKENTRMLVGVFFAIAISDLVLFVLKGAYFRPRPYQTLTGVILPIGQEEGSSLPSGHATRAFAVFALIALQKGGRYSPLLLLSVGAAISRVIIGVHFPSDVLAGALLGLALALVSTIFLSRYVFPKFRPESTRDARR